MSHTRSWSRPLQEAGMGRPSFVTRFDLWDEQQWAAAERLEAALDDIDLVRLVFCDPHGLARSKTLMAGTFRSVLRSGMGFSPGPMLFDTGHAVAIDFREDPGIGVAQIVGAGDFVVVPDPTTFVALPGDEPRTGWVIGDEYLRDGLPHPLSSRHVLRNVFNQYSSHDLIPVIGLEVEWYLTRLLDGSPGNVGNGFGTQGEAPLTEAVNAGYQFNLDNYYDFVQQVADPLAMQLLKLGLPLRSMEHESGPGQLETTFAPLTALDAADGMLLFRTLVKRECARRGYHASFMSLPRIDGFDPSGWHLHQSVLDSASGKNIFATDDGDKLSTSGMLYVNGLLERARDFCVLSVPTVNGYHRLGERYPLSPTYVGATVEDRGCLVRIIDSDHSTHIENRVAEPCANPYLSIAAQLYAGLMGMRAATPAEPGRDEVEVLPGSLREATTLFRDSPALDLLGKPLATCLTKLKESELSRFEQWLAQQDSVDDGVTEWEHREYYGIY